MSNHLKELLDQRNSLIEEAKGVLDVAQKEKRELTAEETVKYDKLFDEAQLKKDTIERHQKQAKMTKELEGIAIDPNGSERGKEDSSDKEYRSALQKYFVRGSHAISETEQRALSQGSAPDGGFLVPREQFVATLLKFVDDNVFIRQRATKFQLTTAQSLGVPSLDTDVSDADWTSEVGSVSEDTTMKTGKRELSPNMLSKLVKVSLKLLQNAVIPVDRLVLERLAYKFAVTEEKAFLLGTGSGQPLGLMVPSALGVTTARDVSTGNTTSSPTVDGLKEAKFALKGQYWSKAAWMFHRDCVKLISKLKDAENRYLWEPSNQVGEPDRLLGFPVMMSEFVSNTFTTTQYVGLVGDFSFYYIAEEMNFAVQRLNELYAGNNQVGFIGRQSIDAMPALAEAFVRVKLG